LVAVDPRIRAAAPVNMISSTMQGGCICENAPILRLHNSNMEIGALMAPRPMIMVSATGDWTRETPHVEYPAIRSIYRLYGAEDRLSNVHVDAQHNYNLSSREAVYRFFGKYFLPGQDWSSFTEPAFTVPSDEQLRVLPEGVPEGLPDSAAIIAGIKERRRALLDQLLPRNRQDAAAFSAQYGSALGAVLGAENVGAGELAAERIDMEERDAHVFERWIIRHPQSGAAIPAYYFRAAAATPQDAVLLLDDDGKAAFTTSEEGAPGPLAEELMAAGKAVLAIDPFIMGETRQNRFKVGTFMDTFQPTDFGYQVQDVLTALAFLRSRRDLTGDIAIVGLGSTGVTAILASAIDGEAPITVADMDGFDFNSDAQWVDRYYTPCIRSIGGLPAAAVQIATRDLYIANSPAPLPFANAIETLDTDSLAALLAGL
ncbi:MAG: hypothetical protein IT368_10990, partial [Candidatus Hydrogenedentes bacterium]|nr:hypothetical protein [Candidatus Hydrogenedentota bacterium]